jgi:hypothetical protein
VGRRISKFDSIHLKEMSFYPPVSIFDEFKVHATKYREVLIEEKSSPMDLQYWMDYLKLFGISHKIPRYDKMNFIKYNNYDIIGLFLLVLFIIYKLFSFVFRFIMNMCCGGK